MLGSIDSFVIMIFQLVDCTCNYKWDNYFFAAVFLVSLIVWLILDKIFGKNRKCQKILQIVNNEIPALAFLLNMLFYFVLGYFELAYGHYNRRFYAVEIACLAAFIIILVWLCYIRYREVYGAEPDDSGDSALTECCD